MQVNVVKFAQFYEAELFKYPKQRVMQMERQVEIEKKRRKEAELEIAQLRKSLSDANNLNQEVAQVYLKTQSMAKDIKD